MNYSTTQEKILSAAESLIQINGYNAFSYKDIAKQIGIKTSSIHYHYPSKEDLAMAVIDWQLYRLSGDLDVIAKNHKISTKKKLSKFIDLIISVTYKDDMKMCLGGMFASDILSVSEDIRGKVRYFFNTLEQWLDVVLGAGMQNKNASQKKRPFSKRVLMQLEGSLLLARLYKDESYFAEVKQFIDESNI